MKYLAVFSFVILANSCHGSTDVQVKAHDPKTGLPYSYSITTVDTPAGLHHRGLNPGNFGPATPGNQGYPYGYGANFGYNPYLAGGFPSPAFNGLPGAFRGAAYPGYLPWAPSQLSGYGVPAAGVSAGQPAGVPATAQ